ncbi:hypothetical protein [Aeromonas dhakensis]|uniref:hypothetical protein n=1 Tax=Aeromonas dhakensis TaxID=196024 RepID=UPI00244C1E84|nr:hypothetical protein [Aeromonas dhakensis]MDH0348199.1 hypothetical protein [Aeromonas dhakensis]
MTTSAVIALTPEALNVLFPEGSQARIDLQRASLDRAARHFAKNALGDDAKALLRAVVSQVNEANMGAVQEELKAILGPSAPGYGRGRFVLNQDTKDRIKEAVQGEVRALVREAVEEAVKGEVERLKDVAASTARTAVYNVLKTEVVNVTQQELEVRVAALKAGLSKPAQE